MARLNRQRPPLRTHEGGVAKRINDELQLRRSVMACLLWERTFYESGEDIAKRIENLVSKVNPSVVSGIAREARSRMNLRHVPLLVTRTMAKLQTHKHLVSDTLYDIIQRPDELAEFMAIYWKDGKQPLSAQVKKGLARAFSKFDEYQLAKYNREREIKLKDVMFLCHAKPKTGVSGYNKAARRRDVPCPVDQGSRLFRKLVEDNLQTPDTWEVAISACKDDFEKKTAFTRLLSENKMGGLAVLRNLRNFQKVGVLDNVIINAIRRMNTSRILPYRFIAAARYAPQFEPYLEEAMMKCLEGKPKLPGHTVILLDVSGSMDQQLSSKSDMRRLDAACGLGILLREMCDRADIFTFSETIVRVPSRRGFALRDAIVGSQQHYGTYLGSAINAIYGTGSIPMENGWLTRHRTVTGFGLNPDRLIVLTDEQAHDKVPDPKRGKGYMINVASYQNGVGYGPWIHVDGFSEAITDYIVAYEDFERMARL